MSEAAVIPHNHLGEAGSSSAGTVLIIDDEAAIRESLETLLQLEGYAVESAASGEEGLVCLGERTFDLVLLDLALPDRNGMDLLAEIRTQDPGLSIIMITAYGTVENAVKAMQVGCSQLHSKALGQRKASSRCARRRGAPPRRRRKHPAQARAQAALQLREHRGQERAHAQDLRSGGPGRAQPLYHPAAGRERHAARN